MVRFDFMVQQTASTLLCAACWGSRCWDLSAGHAPVNEPAVMQGCRVEGLFLDTYSML
jgi:hypothetical protein